MTALLEQVFAQASQLPEGEQDAVAAIVKQMLEDFQQDKKQGQATEDRQPGSAKGLIWMSPDFEEPLEDFKEYM